jgi:PAS domain-containing protein
MASGGTFREPALEVIEGGSSRSTRDRGQALVAAIESLHQPSDVSQLTDAAALAVLSLTAAGVAVAYFDAPELGPQLAVAGAQGSEAAGALVAALRNLLSSATAAAPYVFVRGVSTVVAPFHAGSVRGGILAHRDAGAFEDADGRMLSQFARHVGSAAASAALLARSRRVERIEHAVLDSLHEGVLVASDGRIKVLNRAAARILSVDPQVAVGASLQRLWPELAALVEAAEPLENESVRAGGKHLQLSLRPLWKGKPSAAAILSFTEAEAAEARPRRTSAQPLARLDDLVQRAVDVWGLLRR